MSKINDWAEDKPKQIAIAAQQLARISESGFRVLTLDKSALFKALDLPIDPDNWLKLYKQRGQIFA